MKKNNYLKDFFEELDKLQNKYPDKDVVALVKFKDNKKLRDILGKVINNNELMQEKFIIALIDYYIETNQTINAEQFTEKLDKNQGNFLFEHAKISYKKNDIEKTEGLINSLLNNKEKIKSIQNKEELFEFYLDFSLKKIEQLKNDGKSIDEMIVYLSIVGELIDNIELTEQECSIINNTKNKDNLNVINNFENKISECLGSTCSILPDELLKAFVRKGDNMSAGFYVNKNIFDTPENKVKKIEELYDNNFENFKNKTLILLYFQNCIKLENLDHQKIDTISQIMIDKISNGEITQSEAERAVVRTVEGDKVTLDTVEQHKEMFKTLFLLAGKEEGYLDDIIIKKREALNERLEKTGNDLEAEQEEIVINNGIPL